MIDMEMEEIEAILEKIWDLHDKLSDAIHSISRTHFHNSVKNLRKKHDRKIHNVDDIDAPANAENRTNAGYVFAKEFRLDPEDDSAVQEAKSLNAIRTALENLEDQLEFLHTIQLQQRAERDAAVAQIEQSRIVLAMRLAEHHGKNYKVIEEALAFVGDVHDPARFTSLKKLYDPHRENLVKDKGNGSNLPVKFLVSSFNFAKQSLRLDHLGGIVGNAALVAFSLIALIHLHQVTYKQHPNRQEHMIYNNRSLRKTSLPEGSSSYIDSSNLDVKLARG